MFKKRKHGKRQWKESKENEEVTDKGKEKEKENLTEPKKKKKKKKE